MESELIKLPLEIKGALYNLTAEHLIKVCAILQISAPRKESLTKKALSQLISYVIRYLEQEDLASLEDEGMSENLSIWDTVNKITTVKDVSEIEIQPDQESLQKEVEALRLSLKQEEKAVQDVMDRKTSPCPQFQSTKVTPTFSVQCGTKSSRLRDR